MPEPSSSLESLSGKARKVDELSSESFIIAMVGGVALAVSYLIAQLIHWQFETSFVRTHFLVDTTLPTLSMVVTSLRLRGGFRGIRLSRVAGRLRQRQGELIRQLEQGSANKLLPKDETARIKREYQQTVRKLRVVEKKLDERLFGEEIVEEVRRRRKR